MYLNIAKGSLGEAAYLRILNGSAVEISSALSALTGYSAEDIIDMTEQDVFRKRFRATVNIDNKLLHKGQLECFIFTNDLEAVEVTINIKQSEDISETLYVFAEKPNSKFQTKCPIMGKLFSDNHMGIAMYSCPDLVLLKANDTYVNAIFSMRKSKPDILGICIEDMMPEWKESDDEKLWLKAMLSGETQYLFEQKYGTSLSNTYWDCTIIPVCEQVKTDYIIVMLNNVTERVLSKELIKMQYQIIQDQNTQVRQQKETLEVQNRQLEEIIENMADAIFIFDKEGKNFMQNKIARECHPNTKLEDIGDIYCITEYYDMNDNKIPPEKMVISKVLNGQIIKNEKMKMVQGDKVSYLNVNGVPIYDANRNISLSLILRHDITESIHNKEELKQQQEQLLKAEIEKREALEKTLELKDEFLSTISHEFKTPLTVINSAIQTMELVCKDELSVKGKGFIKKIKQNAFRQLRLVNNLLDITRANAGQIKMHMSNIDIVFLTNAIVYSVKVFAEQKGIEIKFYSSIKKKIIGIDEEKYERVLLNLISNAIKFTPKGKSITIKLSQKTINRKNKVCVQVIDSGVGIPADKQSLIFERFGQVDNSLTRQAEGTGLGLHLVKLFVNALDGIITLESDVGKGSIFTILLPAAKQSVNAEEKRIPELLDNRLVQSTTIEFSDLYL